MTLWNLIRDFFVEHIFGGMLSNGEFVNTNIIGLLYNADTLDGINYDTQKPMFEVSNVDYYSDLQNKLYISLGDWLSTTFTIITLILLVIFLYIFVKWIFKLFSGLLK